ncbi:MAG: OmpA family protein [Spirochaetes bacterium]|nr:OmpA family protein [Spirochaetota bacterium]
MKQLITALAVSALCAASPASAATLTWDIPQNERLEMTRTAKVKFLVNDRMQKTFEERNIIDLTCVERKEASSSVQGRFSVYERRSADDVFRLREQYPSRFDIDRLGRFTVPKEFYMPNLRNLPSFSGRDLAVNEKWSADADLILNTFSIPFKLTFPVEYRLAEIRKKGGAETAVVNFSFIINMDLAGGNYPADFPLKILGKDEGTVWWDLKNNTPTAMKEKYRIIFYFPSGAKQVASNEFQMIIDTAVKLYKPVTKEEKEKAKQELKKEIPKGVDVDTDKRGLVLRLGDVLFDFDSSAIRSDSGEKLGKIAEILRQKYPDREIIVEGHTDIVGAPGYNRRLSRERANSVAKYLKHRAGTDKLSYRGFGADRPIADNRTKEGRQKNRRVEIIIKLE